MLIKEFTKKFGNSSINGNRFILSTCMNERLGLSVNYILALKTRLHIQNPYDCCFHAFEDRLQMSPEMLNDVEEIYNFSIDDCLQWILELENCGNLKNEDVNFHFKMGHAKTEFVVSVIQGNKLLSTKKLNNSYWVDNNNIEPSQTIKV